jgi:hypothetical protein
MESAGWDPLSETQALIDDLLRLIETPLRDVTRIRLALLCYCHITEVDAIYGIIENLLRTVEGNRCSIEPFWDLYPKQDKAKPRSKLDNIRRPPLAVEVVRFVKDHANSIGQTDVATILDDMFNDKVRNSFYHSDYIIYGDEYRIRETRGQFGGVSSASIKISELTEIVNRGIQFYQAFMNTLLFNIRSYKTSKIVMGRIQGDDNPPVPIQLLVHPERGVYGFQSPPKEEEDGNSEISNLDKQAADD